jgi:two-component system, NarL family, nitrate/nitrite response regulator NarL
MVDTNGSGTAALSPAERRILELVADGLTNVEIARQLWVTETTIKFHLSRVYRKLGVANRTAAAMRLRRET